MAFMEQESLEELYVQFKYHELALRIVKSKINKIKENCEHEWKPEEGYLYSGFFCSLCGSTK